MIILHIIYFRNQSLLLQFQTSDCSFKYQHAFASQWNLDKSILDDLSLAMILCGYHFCAGSFSDIYSYLWGCRRFWRSASCQHVSTICFCSISWSGGGCKWRSLYRSRWNSSSRGTFDMSHAAPVKCCAVSCEIRLFAQKWWCKMPYSIIFSFSIGHCVYIYIHM